MGPSLGTIPAGTFRYRDQRYEILKCQWLIDTCLNGESKT
jgi:hypothetical protein